MKDKRFNIHYIAGLIDGEGCIRWAPCRAGVKVYGTPVIELSNTYLPIVKKFASYFGGSVHISRLGIKRGPKFRNAFKCRLYGSKHVKRLLPYLIEKQAQAKLVLKIQKTSVWSRLPLIQKLADLKRINYTI